MDFIEMLAPLSIIVMLVVAVCFIITLVIYKKTDTSSAKKKERLAHAAVFGIIAWLLVLLPFILVIAVIIGSMSFGLLPIVAIPIALAVAFAVALKRYIKNSDSDEIKRNRGIKAIIFGFSAWVMIFVIDSLLALLFSGTISAM